MKRLFCFCLLMSSPAWCAWSPVQNAKGNNGGTTSLTVTFGASLTANNLLVCAAARGNGTSITSVKDGNGNSLALIGSCSGADSASSCNNGQATLGMYNEVIPSGTTTVVLTIPFDNADMICEEFSGNATSTPADVAHQHDNGFSPGSTSWTSNATATLAQTGECVVGAAWEWRVGGQTFTAGSGFTSLATTADGGLYLEYQCPYNSTTGLAATGTLTTNSNSQTYSVVSTFKPSGGGGGATPGSPSKARKLENIGHKIPSAGNVIPAL